MRRRPELLRESMLTAGLRIRGPAELALKLGTAAVVLAVLASLTRRRGGVGVGVGVGVWLALVEAGLRTSLVSGEVPVAVADLDALARPGDLLLCRSYRAADLFEVLVFRHVAAALAHREFHTHVGIVIERGGRKFVLDSLADPSFSELVRAHKPGGVTMRPLAEWAEKYTGRVRLYACPRLRAAADNARLLQYAHRVRHEPFTYLFGGLSCLDTVYGALREQGLFVRPPPDVVLTPGHLADPALYAVPGVAFTKYVVDNAWRRRQARQ